MAAHPVTLRLPEPLYAHFQSRARQTRRTLEAELLDAVATVAADEEQLPQDVARAITDLEFLNDEELWRVARNRLSDKTRSHLEALNLKQQREALTPAEQVTLEQLVHQYDRAVLIRAEAARLLKERGQDPSELLTAR
jgi:hypothetical protein